MKIVTIKTCVLAAFLVLGLAALPAMAASTDAGSTYVEPKVGIYGNSSKNISSMFSYGGEVGYFFMERFSIGGEFLGYVIYQKKFPYSWANTYETAYAFSPSAILRYHFYSDAKFSVFGGLGLGGFFSDVKVPRNGYTSNLTEIGEMGFRVSLTEIVSMQLAGRWQHIGPYSSQGADNWGGNFAVKFAF